MRHRVLLPLLCAAVLMGETHALAAPPTLPSSRHDEARALLDEGDRALRAGDAEAALRHFEAAHRTDQNPLYHFYIAHALKALGRFEQALSSAQVARSAALDASDQQVIDALVAEIRSHMPARAAAPTAPGPRTAPATLNSEALTTGQRPVNRAFVRSGMIVGAAGVAMLGTGAAFALAVRNKNNEMAAERMKRAPDYPEAAHYKQLMADARSAERKQWFALSLGVVALAGGSVLYFLGRPGESPSARVSAWVLPSSAGAQIGRNF